MRGRHAAACRASHQNDILPEMGRQYLDFIREHLPPRAAESEIAFLHQTKHVQSMVIEKGHPTSIEEQEDEAACRRGFGDMPLLILTEKWVYSSAATEQEREEARREDERQMRLAGLSSRGKKIDLDSGHLIPLENPSAVVDAIRHVTFGAREME